MTKNRSMRIAVLVLALALITCCFVGTTFAKYTSSATGSSTMTVAKWSFDGFDVTDDEIEFTLFESIVDEDGSEETDVREADEDTVYVAPGTKGAFNFTVKNTSDVNAKFNFKLDTAAFADLPIVFTYKLNGSVVEATALQNVDLLMDQDTATVVDVEWVWVYETEGNASDATDTAKGIAAAQAAITATATATIDIWQVD